MKKVASLITAAALMAASTGVAFGWNFSDNDISVKNSGFSNQWTVSASLSNTGLNKFAGNDDGGFYTGAAYTESLAETHANTFSTGVSACSACSWRGGDTRVSNFGTADQVTVSVAAANSGMNGFYHNDDGSFGTGAASSISASGSFSNVFTTSIVR